MKIRLKEIRESRDLKIQQMVQRLGVKDSRYRKWESNSAQIPLEFACRCADILHCTLDELAGRRVPEQPSMTTDEQRIVDVYREASPTDRDMVDMVIETAARHMDESAKNEARGA